MSIALDVFGDRWSLLIIRDLLFKDVSTYKAFLGAGECIATNILSDRLRRLEAEGLIARGRAADRRSVTYRLTPKGLDLAPVLVEMILWADRYEDTAAPPGTIRRMTSDRAAFIADLRAGAQRRR